MASRIRLKMGKTNVKIPAYASESEYVRIANEAMRRIKEDLEYIINEVEDATPEIMLEALQPIFDKSQEYCPKDTGALRDSGYLEITSFRGNPTVEMGYAKGGNPSYAAYVHEMVNIPHEPPTQAKFLERAVNEGVGDLIDTLTSKYQDVIGLP